MSYTEIYSFNKKGEPDFLGETPNAWRGAMAVWKILEEKHLPSLPMPDWALGEKREYWSRTTIPHFDDSKPNPMKEIWSLFDGDKLSYSEKVVLGSTFDNIVIKFENIDKVIEAFKNFDETTSLSEQATILEGLLKNDDIMAVAFNQTSIVDDGWLTHDYDEVKDESISYNLLTGEKHWFLFDELK